MEQIVFKGELVKLRPYKKGEADEVLKSISNKDVEKYLRPGIPFPITIMDEEKWLEKQSAFSDEYNFAIETLEGQKYIGGCGIHRIDHKNSHCEVGIFIGEDGYRSKGYGTEALKILVQFCFFEMNMNKVKLNVYGFNARAQKSYKKVGFKEEGILRQELYRFGKYHDVHLMSILRSEFDELYGENAFSI